jgi:hypothetical protein
MEDNETKLADTTSNGTPSNDAVSVTTSDGRVIPLSVFRDEFEWLRSDFYNLMSRVIQLEEENRSLKQKLDENDYHTISYRNRVDNHDEILNQILGKINKVSEYVGEMSKDYIREYVYANTE